MPATMTPTLPSSTKAFDEMSEPAQRLWTALSVIKEHGESMYGKPEADSNGEQFSGAAQRYLEINSQMDRLKGEKEKLRDFLFDRLVARKLGVIECPCGRVTLSAFSKEIMDREYLKEVAPEAFATVPDGLRLNVLKPR